MREKCLDLWYLKKYINCTLLARILWRPVEIPNAVLLKCNSLDVLLQYTSFPDSVMRSILQSQKGPQTHNVNYPGRSGGMSRELEYHSTSPNPSFNCAESV